MNADDRQELIDNLDSARLAAKWVVDHAHRAHEYDRPYAELALEHLEEAIRILREEDPAGDERCASCNCPWSEHTLRMMPPKREGCDGFECSEDHDADGSECPLRSVSEPCWGIICMWDCGPVDWLRYVDGYGEQKAPILFVTKELAEERVAERRRTTSGIKYEVRLFAGAEAKA